MADLPLGKNVYNNYEDVIIPQNIRSTHMQIIGASGEGKSKFMEYMIRKDIVYDRGLCLIDPHGYLFNDIVKWMTDKKMLDRKFPKKVILIDPSNDKWAFGFNPLWCQDGVDISYHVDAMVKATAKVWGGEDTDKTPLMKRVLRILFHALAENNLSLLEAGLMLNPNNKRFREHITSKVKDWIIREQWEYFNELKGKQFYDECGSAINRVLEFLASKDIRSIIGQITNTLDLKKVMDEGYILLVNLSTSHKISDDNARLLGTLIVNDLFLKARSRAPKSKPFYLYIDECARYINEDIGRILDEGRKFGLHLILAHQHLAQLRKAGDDIYSAVMTDAKTKVIFGGLSAEDAKVLAEQIFLGEVDYKENKFERITVVGYTTRWMRSYSTGRSIAMGSTSGSGETETDAYGLGRSDAENEGGGLSWDIYNEATNYNSNYSSMSGTQSNDMHSSARNNMESESYVEQESTTEGMNEALIPILGSEPGTMFSLEEQINKQMALMVNQPQRQAILKLPKSRTIVLRTPDVKGAYAKNSEIMEFKEKCFKQADLHKLGCSSRAIIEASIVERHINLIALANKEDQPLRKTEDFLEEEKTNIYVPTKKTQV
jgi:hypothetical protein